MAAFSMYGRAEAEQGIALDEDVKEKMMYNYQVCSTVSFSNEAMHLVHLKQLESTFQWNCYNGDTIQFYVLPCARMQGSTMTCESE